MVEATQQLFTGTGVVCYAGTEHDALVTLDLESYCLIAQHPRTPSAKDLLAERREWMREKAHLRDVCLHTINGELRAPELPGLLIVSYGPGAWASLDSGVNRALQRTPVRAGIVTLKLQPALSLLAFNHQPRSLAQNELLYHGGVPKPHPFRCEAQGATYVVTESHDHLCIQSNAPLWANERRINLALSLMQGAPVALLAAYEENTFHVNLARPTSYQQSHRLYDEVGVAGDLFEALLGFLLPLSDAEFRRWEKAIFFFVEGKSSFADLDLRVTHLFVFLEMFDDSRTLSAAPLAEMLDISLSDARLVCEVRNRVVHQHHDLTDALREADAHLRRVDPNYTLSAFDLPGAPGPATTNFSLRLAERINAFILKQIGWQRGWHNYDYLFRRPDAGRT